MTAQQAADAGLDPLDVPQPSAAEVRLGDGRLVVVVPVDRLEFGRLARLVRAERAREAAA